MQGAGHILRIFDVLLFWPFHREKQVAGAGALHGSGGKAAGQILAIEIFEVSPLEADVQEADRLRRLLLRIDLDKLPVIYLDKRLRCYSILAQGEGLLEA